MLGAQLVKNSEVVGAADRNELAWRVIVGTAGVIVAARRDHRRQFAGSISDRENLIRRAPAHRRQRLDFYIGEFHLIVDVRRVLQMRQIEHAGDRQPGEDARMLQETGGEMAARRPAHQNQWPGDAMPHRVRR